MSNPFDEDYFMHGKKAGVSLYENYRWMPDLTIPMVKRIIDHCGILGGIGTLESQADLILDFGAARGYVVRAFRELGYVAFGAEISDWAMQNCDPEVFGMIGHPDVMLHDGEGEGIGALGPAEYDWIIAKDVLEHVDGVQACIDRLMTHARKGVFVVVPLAKLWHEIPLGEKSVYVIPDYEKDVTHLHRCTLRRWAGMFMRDGWSVEARYRIPGIKDNYYKPGWERGNGFITARRI